jgi:hypothetical protein
LTEEQVSRKMVLTSGRDWGLRKLRGEPANVAIQQLGVFMATVPSILSEPILVANLPLPPEEAAELERYLRSGRFTRSERAFVEENFKLRHHYAGRFVVATAGRSGLQIHAIDLESPDEVDELTKRLQAQGHHNVLCLFPTTRNEPDVAILTGNPQS